MAEDGTQDTTTTDDDGLSIDAARELLLSKGQHVLAPEDFHKVKTKAAEKAEQRAAELQRQLDSISAEHRKLAEWKSQVDNQGKGESEIWAERQRAWEKADREKSEAISAAKKERDEIHSQLAKERVENRLRGLLTGVTQGGEEAALLWAQTKIGKRLSTNDAGELVWTTETGVPHEGVAAHNMVMEWWNSDAQKFLRSGHNPGPPTSGANTTPPQTKEVYVQLDPRKYSAAERLEHAKRWQREHGTGGVLGR